MRRTIVVALAVAAVVAALAWLGTRDAVDAPPTTPDVAHVPRPQVTRADTRVERPAPAIAATIEGTVVRGENELPDVGRLVELLQGERVVARATTDGIGEFAFRAVAPGEQHEVRVAADDCLTVRVRSIALVPDEHRHVGTLVLAPPRVVPVTVTDETGAPVPGTTVRVYREPRGAYHRHRAVPPPSPVSTIELDASGNGELQLAYGCAHTITAQAEGYARVAAPLAEMLLMEGDGRLRLALAPAHSLTGTVVDPAGVLVPDTVVLARRRQRVWGYHGERADSSALWHATRTDAAGAFEFTDLPPGTIDLCCGRDGTLPGEGTSVNVPAVTDVRLVLRETASIGGRATDAGTGAPLAGVVVAYMIGEFAGTVVTDENGDYRVDGLPSGDLVHMDLWAPPGWTGPVERGTQRVVSGVWGGSSQEWLHAGEHLTIDVSYVRTAVVEGSVTADGAPAAHAWVRVYTLPEPPLPASRSTTRADAAGYYRIDDAVPGRAYALALPSSVTSQDEDSAFSDLWKERYESEQARNEAAVAISPSAVTRLNVEALLPEDFESWDEWDARSARQDEEFERNSGGRRVRVSGRVTTSDGLPLREVRVGADSGEAFARVDVEDLFAPWKLLVVGADGRFEGAVFVLPSRPDDADDPAAAVPFTFHVSAVDARHGAVARHVTIPANAPDEIVEVDLVLPPLPVLRGTVVCDGKPVPHAEVYSGHALIARANADGAFEIALATGTHYLEARAEGYVESDVYDVWMPQQESVELELAAARTLSGTVTDGAGRPVAGVLVHPVDEDGDRLRGYDENWAGGNTPLTGADGRFRFDRLPRTPVYLELAASDRGPVVTARFTAGPFWPEDDDVQVVTRPPRRLTGRAVFPDGTERRYVRVHATALEDARAAGGRDRETSSDNGTFSFDDLLAAPYLLSVAPAPSSKLQPVEVEIDAEQDDVDVLLEGSAVISGTARWLDGSPFVAVLQLRPLGGVATGVTDWNLPIGVERDGSFAAYVRSGASYAIELYRGDWDDAIWLTGGEMVLAGTTGVEIVATRVVDGIDPDARGAGVVAGTIVTTGGDALAGADVHVIGPTGAVSRVTTDAEGSFSVTGVAADGDTTTASVAVFAEGRCSTQFDDVKIGTSDLRLALSPGRTISGRLLTADGAPATGYRLRALRASNPIHDLWRADPDADGAFVLTGVARGTWTLEAIVERRDGIHAVVPLGTASGGAKNLALRLP